MRRFSLEQWSAHLRGMAPPAPDPGGALGAGELDVPFRMAVCGADRVLPPGPAGAGEVGLWWARVDRRVDVEAALAAGSGRGPLLPRRRFRAIEVWTDADLAALHALWWLARIRGRADWMGRVAEARDWHLEHTQPDNATNRPWALHVFLLAGSAEATHYAGTLLHNCIALEGRPDPLSAWILLDAARGVEEAVRRRRGAGEPPRGGGGNLDYTAGRRQGDALCPMP